MKLFRQSALLALTVWVCCISQSGAADNEPAKPEDTEVWQPEPAIVTPAPDGTAPSDAVVLFDGSNLNAWRHRDGGDVQWALNGDAMTVAAGSGDIETVRYFGDVQLHIEWRTPEVVDGEGQRRSNSGVILQNRYEVQVLDSFDNRTYSNGQAASIYKQHIPLVNASRPPGVWQSYDIVFLAPRFSDDGALQRPAYVTVLHNGILVQNHVEIQGPTVYLGTPAYTPHDAKQPLSLQDHGNPVSYRNIWVRELDTD